MVYLKENTYFLVKNKFIPWRNYTKINVEMYLISNFDFNIYLKAEGLNTITLIIILISSVFVIIVIIILLIYYYSKMKNSVQIEEKVKNDDNISAGKSIIPPQFEPEANISEQIQNDIKNYQKEQQDLERASSNFNSSNDNRLHQIVNKNSSNIELIVDDLSISNHESRISNKNFSVFNQKELTNNNNRAYTYYKPDNIKIINELNESINLKEIKINNIFNNYSKKIDSIIFKENYDNDIKEIISPNLKNSQNLGSSNKTQLKETLSINSFGNQNLKIEKVGIFSITIRSEPNESFYNGSDSMHKEIENMSMKERKFKSNLNASK